MAMVYLGLKLHKELPAIVLMQKRRIFCEMFFLSKHTIQFIIKM